MLNDMKFEKIVTVESEGEAEENSIVQEGQ